MPAQDLALAYDQLALRHSTLAEWPALAPAAPQPLRVQHSATPHLPAARWVLYTLAGPALTGVSLGAAPKLAGTVPTNVINTVTEDERPAASGSIQFSLRRNLGAHWSLGAGLGAAAYATEATLSQRLLGSPAGAGSSLDPLGRNDSTIIVKQYRKTYETFTLPLRVGYAWQPGTRWQLGLLAGADALLLARVNETWTLPTQTANNISSSADYRRFGLGTSLGLEAGYHLSPRCLLVAQPTFTYQLTALQKDRDGVAPRHLWGASLLLGMAYEFR
jgi:hypothetical protein